ncbi:MAG: hypothetical protein ACD_23C01176G0001 [uncultured bacterium]|nr:MAG: hypothetical protein ACD_23C01176G0001 [uncultured bacterium]
MFQTCHQISHAKRATDPADQCLAAFFQRIDTSVLCVNGYIHDNGWQSVCVVLHQFDATGQGHLTGVARPFQCALQARVGKQVKSKRLDVAALKRLNQDNRCILGAFSFRLDPVVGNPEAVHISQVAWLLGLGHPDGNGKPLQVVLYMLQLQRLVVLSEVAARYLAGTFVQPLDTAQYQIDIRNSLVNVLCDKIGGFLKNMLALVKQVTFFFGPIDSRQPQHGQRDQRCD